MNMKKSKFTIGMFLILFSSGNIVAQSHFPKSQMSRRNFRTIRIFSKLGKIAMIAITAMFIAESVNAQTFNHIVIFVELADTKFDYPLQQTADVINGSNEMNISFSKYFELASCGKIQYKNYFPIEGENIYVVKLPWTWKDVLASYLGGNDPINGACYNIFKIGKAAVEAVVDKFPTDIDFDVNNDGVVDFISIYVAAKYVNDQTTCPSHAGGIEAGTPEINGKTIVDVAYSTWSEKDGIIKEDMAKYNLGISLHETIHTFDIDDYYYYYSTEHQKASLGDWDIMCSGQTVVEYEYDPDCNCHKPLMLPTFPSAYMREKLNWIDIPEITTNGKYTLYPATSGKTDRVAYKICTNADPTKKEYIVVEYRQKGDKKSFDGGIYGSGLVIYKVNTQFLSNAVAGGSSNATVDRLIAESEVMVFRPGGTHVSFGDITKSFFSADAGRTSFTPDSDPYPFLTSGERITDIYITNISSAGETISFDFSRSPSEDATLKSLTVSNGELSPVFAADVTEYTVDVAYSVNNITITGTANHANATVANVTGKALEVGENPISITVTAEDGATKKDYTVTVVRAEKVTSADNTDAQFARVYPNPTDGVIILEFEMEGVYIITLADMSGRILIRETATGQTVQLDVNAYPAGVYLLTIDNGKQKTTTRVVKK